MRAIRSASAFLVSLLMLATSACYRAVPTAGGAPSVGRELVLELSERGSLELAPQLGAQLKSVTGRVTEFNEGGYRVAVTETTDRSRIETLWRGEPATIRQDYVMGLSERRLDKGRSWLVAGIAMAGVALAGKAFGVDYGLGRVFGTGGGGTRQ